MHIKNICTLSTQKFVIMKIKILLLWLITAASPLFAANNYWEQLPAFSHLVELNSQWLKHQEYAPNHLISFSSDQDRIAYHLDLVIAYLETNSPSNLDKKQAKNRKNLLNQLKTYSIERHFPQNHFHQVRTPYFIDNYNNYCAVGYLMKVSGNETLARKIQSQYNYDYVEDIKTQGVAEWATAYGFTVDELKWIQPNYNPNAFTVPIGEEVNGPITALYNDGSSIYLAGDYDKLGDSPFEGILTYSGNELKKSDIAIEGSVLAIGKGLNGSLLFGGQLKLDGIAYPMVSYNNGEYVAYDFEDEDIEIHQLAISEDGNSIIAATRNIYENNYNKIYLISENKKEAILEIYGQVNDLIFEGIVGKLDTVNLLNDGTKKPLGNGSFLSFKDGNWYFPEIINPDSSNQLEFTAIAKFEDSIITFASAKYNQISLWSLSNNKLIKKTIHASSTGIVKDVFVSDNIIYASGKFENYSMHESSNFMMLDKKDYLMTHGGYYSKGSIDFVTVHNSQVILAGDYETGMYAGSYLGAPLGLQYNLKYLGAYSSVPSSIEQQQNAKISLFPNPTKEQLTVQVANINELKITNIKGQEFSPNYQLNTDKTQVDVTSLAKGNYLLQVTTKDGLVLSSYFLKE